MAKKEKKGIFSLFGKRGAAAEAAETARQNAAAPQSGAGAGTAGETTPQQAEIDENAKNILPAKESELYKTYCFIKGLPPLEAEDSFDVSVFHAPGLVPNEETRALLKGLGNKALAMLQKWRDADGDAVEAESAILVSGDKMQAYLFCFPPLFGGRDVTPADVEGWLAKQNIGYGVLQNELASFCAEKAYMQLFLVARGSPVQNGEDGFVTDKYNRDTDIHLTVKDDNTVDYRELGWLQTVEAGDVICTIAPPTQPVNGTNVYGQPVLGKQGRKAQAPSGQNTALNEAGTELAAKIGGVLCFAANRFKVDPMLIVNGHVDTAVGNIDTIGDVLVQNDVQEGFTVKATGNVIIKGGVEGAFIQAGGNVQIGLGMSGNSQGSITAGKDVYSKFFENTKVVAAGSVICDTIINSTIESENEVLVKTGRSTIIGGSITALYRVAALKIGNESNRTMEITLGNTPAFLADKARLEEQRAAMAAAIAEKEKSLAFLARQADTPENRQRQNEIQLSLKTGRMRQARLEQDYERMLARQVDVARCRLQAEVAYPPLQVNMGPASLTVRKTLYNVLMYYKDGEVHVANV